MWAGMYLVVPSVGKASLGASTRFRFNRVLIFTSHVVMYLIRTRGPDQIWGTVLQLHPMVTQAGSRGRLLERATVHLPRGSAGSWCGRETQVCTPLLTRWAQGFPHPTWRLLLGVGAAPNSEGLVGGVCPVGVCLWGSATTHRPHENGHPVLLRGAWGCRQATTVHRNL